MAERKTTTLRIVHELDALLEEKARKRGVSKNAVITDALWASVKENEEVSV